MKMILINIWQLIRSQFILQFLLISIILFIFYSNGSYKIEKVGVISAGEEELLDFAQFKYDGNDAIKSLEEIKRLNQSDKRKLIVDFLMEEVSAKEALNKNLSYNEYDIKARLEKSLEAYLLSQINKQNSVSTKELEDFYNNNKDRYYEQEKVSFVHIFIDPLLAGGDINALNKADWLQQELSANNIDPNDAPKYSDNYLYGLNIIDKDETYITQVFDSKLAYQIMFSSPNRAWFGPLKSAYGYHIIFIYNRKGAGYPKIEDIKQRLIFDYQVDYEQRYITERKLDLLKKYYLDIPRQWKKIIEG